MLLEELLIRRLKRQALVETRQVPLGAIKDAIVAYLQPFRLTQSEIIDVDIQGLTTDLVDIKIYRKKDRGPDRQKL